MRSKQHVAGTQPVSARSPEGELPPSIRAPEGALGANTGVLLAVLLLLVWAASHLSALLLFKLEWPQVVFAPLLIAWLSWLYVGLFIVAHDCMHGSLSKSPTWNRRIGALCLTVYAGFSFQTMLAKHRAHHQYPGTERDPDFLASDQRTFARWYAKFFREYTSLRQLAMITVMVWSYVLIFGAPLVNVLLFWAVPSILSSVQLFTFGTYLPHRPGDEPFPDHHNARTNDYPFWLSLVTCFHFGYHLEHHRAPAVPWWRLPSLAALARPRAGFDSALARPRAGFDHLES